MKKLFISVLAIASLVACNTEEVLVQQGNPAIGFESIVDNATRAEDPSITADDLTGFNVWAFMDEAAGVVFNAEDVEKGANGYTYTNIQYWIPGHDYYFAALAPMDSANWTVDTAGADVNGLGKVSFTNVNGTEDLLYAAKTVSTQNMAAGQDMEKVKFQFNHLLSKVNFTFKNGFSNGIYSFVVKDVEMKAPKAGSIDLAVENWWDNDDWNITGEKVTLDFGDVVQLYADSQKGAISATAAAERLTIPADADYSYEITFTIDLYVSGVLAGTYNKTANVNGVALEMGKAYNFTTTISQDNVAENGEALKPIEFDVEGVNEWVNAGADVDYVTSTKVATAAELKAAIEAGVNVTLTNNLTLDNGELVVAAGNEVNVDLNGYTLTVASLDPIKNNGKMTIANGEVVAGNTENTRRCIYNYGEMVIENMEFVQTYGAKGAAINNEGTMTIKSATVNSVYYSIWNSGANAVLTIEDGTFNCVGDNASWQSSSDSVAWCYAVTNRLGAKMVVNGGTFTGNHGVIAAYDGADVTLNAGTFNCYATMSGNSDWVLYAAYDAVIRYNAANCTLIHAVKAADACCTTEENGTVVAF